MLLKDEYAAFKAAWIARNATPQAEPQAPQVTPQAPQAPQMIDTEAIVRQACEAAVQVVSSMMPSLIASALAAVNG